MGYFALEMNRYFDFRFEARIVLYLNEVYFREREIGAENLE